MARSQTARSGIGVVNGTVCQYRDTLWSINIPALGHGHVTPRIRGPAPADGLIIGRASAGGVTVGTRQAASRGPRRADHNHLLGVITPTPPE